MHTSHLSLYLSASCRDCRIVLSICACTSSEMCVCWRCAIDDEWWRLTLWPQWAQRSVYCSTENIQNLKLIALLLRETAKRSCRQLSLLWRTSETKWCDKLMRSSTVANRHAAIQQCLECSRISSRANPVHHFEGQFPSCHLPSSS